MIEMSRPRKGLAPSNIKLTNLADSSEEVLFHSLLCHVRVLQIMFVGRWSGLKDIFRALEGEDKWEFSPFFQAGM